MTTTDTRAGQFFAAPPMAGPVLEWRPEYGTIDDEGETVDLGGGVYVYSSPDYTLDVNTLYVTTSDGVVVVDSQLLPRHAERVLRRHPGPHRRAHPVRDQQPPPPRPRLRQPRVRRGRRRAGVELLHGPHDRPELVLVSDVPPGHLRGHLPATYAVPRNTFVRSRELGWARPRCSCSSSPTARPCRASRST